VELLLVVRNKMPSAGHSYGELAARSSGLPAFTGVQARDKAAGFTARKMSNNLELSKQ
jgi:hypothetical protein